ncbi:MAG: sodium:proton antiporter [Saprospiraceae bacterium]|nr:sodium:proton antiporter [Saprospiraceae bacterium]
MDLFVIATVLIVLSALFGYLNLRILRLPNTIGLMIIAILFTIGLFLSARVNPTLLLIAEDLVSQIDFKILLLDVMLGFLLFAGAMHTNFDQLKVQRWPVLLFSTVGVLTSTFLVGGITYYVLNALGLQIEFIHCLLFGALISPTDPIAVLGILKKAGVPKKLETKIVGESLFNDGVGVVVFLTILSVAVGGEGGHGGGDLQSIVKLFGQEVLGGVVFGGLIGYLTFLLLKSIDDYEIEVLITLACVMGGYVLAHKLHLSAPLAIVVAGLIVGNDTVRDSSMSKTTERFVDMFWELVDMLLNAVLFVLIGLELLVVHFEWNFVIAGLVTIIIVLLSRYMSLILPVSIFQKRLEFLPHTSKILTWGGLRGGISIALALSLPEEMSRDILLPITYIVVVFSIIVQGLTIGKLTTRLIGREMTQAKTDSH